MNKILTALLSTTLLTVAGNPIVPTTPTMCVESIVPKTIEYGFYNNTELDKSMLDTNATVRIIIDTDTILYGNDGVESTIVQGPVVGPLPLSPVVVNETVFEVVQCIETL